MRKKNIPKLCELGLQTDQLFILLVIMIYTFIILHYENGAIHII